MMPRTKKRKQPKGIAVSGNEARCSGVRSRIGLDFDKLREAGWTISERQSSSGDKILFRYVNPIGKTLKSNKDVRKELTRASSWKLMNLQVMLSVLSLFILFPIVFSVAFWLSFAYARTILYFFYLYLPLKAICCHIIKKVRGRGKLTFQTTAFR